MKNLSFIFPKQINVKQSDALFVLRFANISIYQTTVDIEV